MASVAEPLSGEGEPVADDQCGRDRCERAHWCHGHGASDHILQKKRLADLAGALKELACLEMASDEVLAQPRLLERTGGV